MNGWAGDVGGMFPQGLPPPANENVDGVSLSYYKVGMDDFLPIVAVTDRTFVASTSRAWSLALTKAAASGTEKQLTLDFRLNFKPVYDLAGKWLAFAAQNPGAFFSDGDAAANFKKSEPDYASMLQSLRAFDGISVQEYQENGVQRISSQIRWDEK